MGSSVRKIIMIAVMVVVLGVLVPVLFPLITGSDTAIQALTGTDDGTVTLQALWPILLVVCGIGIPVGVVIWALKKFNLM